MTHTLRSKFFPGALASLLLLGHVRDASGITNNISDNSISNVIVAVAKQRATTLTPVDGSYPAATTVATARSAKQATINWEYAWGVDLYGQLHVKDATGYTNAENYVLNHNLICARYYGWLVSLTNTVTDPANLANFQGGTSLGTFFTLGKLDYCGSMTAQMLEGALRHADGLTIEQLQMAIVTANYITSGQARLPDGTLWRPEREATIWADDLYMSCPFLVRWYQYTGNTNFLDDAARQVVNMAGYLQDTNGLWFHGYYCTNHFVNGIKWGRANGWAMVTTVEVLSAMPTNHPARTNLLSILRRHIAGVEAVQAPDGMWHQVLDHPEVWEETSCTALCAYSIARAVNRGWIDPTNMAVARKAFAAIAQLQVDASSRISNICPGTHVDTNLSYYATETPNYNERHGPGPVMLAGAEILLTPKLGISQNGKQAAISWNAGLTNFNLDATTNLADWTVWTNLPVINSWQSVVTDSNANCRFFRLNSPSQCYPPAPLNFEAESLARTTNGATATVSALDANASGGYFVTLNGDGVGDYIEFTLTNVSAGAYRLKLVFPSGSNRGQLGLKLDSNPLGGTLDEYWATKVYLLWDFGPVTFMSTGDHTVRLTATGKNVASSSYTITADKFMLMPQ
jgi:rhamnogalacturonyl hydrolase YesR